MIHVIYIRETLCHHHHVGCMHLMRLYCNTINTSGWFQPQLKSIGQIGIISTGIRVKIKDM